jgi:hypothetical protein
VAQLQPPAGAGGEAVGLVEQQPGDATADGAAAEQGDAEGFTHGDIGRLGFTPHW